MSGCTSRASEERALLRDQFLQLSGWGDGERALLAADASHRTYDRIRLGSESVVLMNAPPDLEKVEPFIEMTEQLLRFGYSVPRILAKDIENGFLLLEDLGDATFTNLLNDGVDERALYELAVDLLTDLHKRAPWVGFSAPPYDAGRLVEEAGRMLRWYTPLIVGDEFSSDIVRSYEAVWRGAAAKMEYGPATLVLRDFHVDNLMIVDGRDGVAACGLLDYQDALSGPMAYDLVSLLQDARRDLSPGLEEAMLERYRAQSSIEDWDRFLSSYYALGAQRSIKILGQFGRQLGFFGRALYLVHIPRIWDYIHRDLERAGLTQVSAWLDQYFPEELRRVPDKTARLPSHISPEIKR